MPQDKDVKRIVRRRMAETGERYTQARSQVRAAPPPNDEQPRRESAPSRDWVEVVLAPDAAIRVHMATGQHVVILKEKDGERWLSIWIGMPEATAIQVAVQGITTSRPLTADLLVQTIGSFGATVRNVLITRLEDGVFFASITVDGASADPAPIDARPSDAVSVAVRTGAPILVARAVMDAAAVTAHDDLRPPGHDHEASPQVDPETLQAFMLIEHASEKVVAQLHLAAAPEAGTLIRLQSAGGVETYRILGMAGRPEPGKVPRFLCLRVDPEAVTDPVIPPTEV